jgi:DNA-binding CsgD family transcriptional regulator
MHNPHAAMNIDFLASTSDVPEKKRDLVPPGILGRLDDAQKNMMLWFMQGLSKAEMAQNAGVGVDVMMQSFADMRKTLGVTDDCNLLCLVHGSADANKLKAATKKYGLTQEENKVLMLRLAGTSILDISAGLRKDAGDIMQGIFRKTGTRTLQSLFDVVHNARDVVSQPSQPKINGNGHGNAAISENLKQAQPAAHAVNPNGVVVKGIPVDDKTAYDDEIIPAEIADKLSARELQIARFKLRGLSYIDIADALDLSRSTVNGHIKSIYKKLDIHNENAFFNMIYGDIYPRELAAISKHFGITKSEEEVLGRILSGLSVENVIEDMKLSKHTVYDHIRSIHTKMNVHGRDQVFFAAHDFLDSERAAKNQTTVEEQANSGGNTTPAALTPG